MSKQLILVHGMFQTPKSWERWIPQLSARGFDCSTFAWPMHDGEPAALRANPPAGLGDLRLRTVIDALVQKIGTSKPIIIGHSVGGLLAQIMLNRSLVSAAVAIDSVAPNGIIDFDFSSLKNIAVIANPLKGSEPVYMDAETFHGAFATSLGKDAATAEFERTAVHDSRNVLRDCMGEDGKIDAKRPHAPLLLVGGEKDEIIPQHLTEKNAAAYEGAVGKVTFKAFPGRSHYICNEPGWEEVCAFVGEWLNANAGVAGSDTASRSAA